jgi:uncharacterized protein (DUF1800 family)
MIASTPSTFRPPGTLVPDPLSAYAGPWDARLAAHLLRRAAFGGSPEDVARLAGGGMNAAVDSLVRLPALPPPPMPELIDDAEGRRLRADMNLGAAATGATASQAASGMQMSAMPQSMASPGADSAPDGAVSALVMARKARGVLRRQQDRVNVTWWLDRMLTTQAPLQEKVTLFLHGNFASSANQKGVYGLEIVNQNQLLRRYALGNWRELTHGVARDISMLKYLDNARNVKAHPNENFARELMELFTLGIGNYTEADVRESARAFTGYTFRRRTGEFFFNAAQHDDGSKTFLGKTGNLTGDDVIEIVFKQPAAPKHFARKLLEFFVYSDPEPQLVDELAALIRKNDFNMAPVFSTLFRSKVFYADRSYRALVKSPVEFVIGSYKLFGVTEVGRDAIPVLRRMGQVPFHPPSVKGWDGGASWLNTQTVLARENFASALMANGMQGKNFLSAPPASVKDTTRLLSSEILQGDASQASLANVESYLDGRGTSANGTLSGENYDERIRGAAYLTMAMPAYQLS